MDFDFFSLEEPQSFYASPYDMSSSVDNDELQAEEKYEIAVSWATMTGTWALMVLICGARVSVLLLLFFIFILSASTRDVGLGKDLADGDIHSYTPEDFSYEPSA